MYCTNKVPKKEKNPEKNRNLKIIEKKPHSIAQND